MEPKADSEHKLLVEVEVGKYKTAAAYMSKETKLNICHNSGIGCRKVSASTKGDWIEIKRIKRNCTIRSESQGSPRLVSYMDAEEEAYHKCTSEVPEWK